MENEKYQINLPDGTTQLTILQGEAKKPNNPVAVKFDGGIQSVTDYFKARGVFVDAFMDNAINLGKAIVVVDRSKWTITLYQDPHNILAPVIVGSLSDNPDLIDFKINRMDSHRFTAKELCNHLRMRSYWFSDREECLKVVEYLMKYKARITTELETSNDMKGNKKDSYQTQLAHEMKADFKLNMPIFKAGPNQTFRVEVMCDITDGSILFWLESEELASGRIRGAEYHLKTEIDLLRAYGDNLVIIQR